MTSRTVEKSRRPAAVSLPELERLTADLLSRNPFPVLALDGRCGAGKSTLAARLADLFSCNVIHMDDFFLPPPLRTPSRLSEPGGNIHYERFLAEAAPLLLRRPEGGYRAYSCQTGAYTERIFEKSRPLTVVEGSYAMHPRLRPLYDMSVFADIAPGLQQKRLLRRNGAEALDSFLMKWIPLEETYFSQCGVRDACDYIIRLTDNMER